MSSAVEQLEGALSLLVAGWAVVVLVMDCSTGKLFPIGGGSKRVGGSGGLGGLSGISLPTHLPYDAQSEGIESRSYSGLYKRDGSEATASAGGEGVAGRSARCAYDALRRAKFIRIASALGISGFCDGTPTAPNPARVLIEQKKEGGRGCE